MISHGSSEPDEVGSISVPTFWMRKQAQRGSVTSPRNTQLGEAGTGIQVPLIAEPLALASSHLSPLCAEEHQVPA